MPNENGAVCAACGSFHRNEGGLTLQKCGQSQWLAMFLVFKTTLLLLCCTAVSRGQTVEVEQRALPGANYIQSVSLSWSIVANYSGWDPTETNKRSVPTRRSSRTKLLWFLAYQALGLLTFHWCSCGDYILLCFIKVRGGGGGETNIRWSFFLCFLATSLLLK